MVGHQRLLPGFTMVHVWRATGWRGELLRLLSPYTNSSLIRDINEVIGMATKAKGNGRVAGKATPDKNFTTFVNFTLSAECADDMRDKFPNVNSVLDALEVFLETGYKVGFSYDFPRGAVICALTCRNEESVNEGKTLTSFAGTWEDALRAAAYKHFFALEQDWRRAETNENRPAFG